MKKLKLADIPCAPGVYRFFNSEEKVIYVGKAKNLRRRISQYQNAKRCKAHAKMRRILRHSRRLEFEVCESELAALIRENELIISLKPEWNVASAFYFLYPMIGILEKQGDLYFCYTTEPELSPQFQFHGAYRSRFRTRTGFFCLMELLGYIGHAIPRKNLIKGGIVPRVAKYTFVFGFRQIPFFWQEILPSYFKGENLRAVEELSLLLLERAGARVKRKEVQISLQELKQWFIHEMKPLQIARTKTNILAYPVLQKQRDLLFIMLRNPFPMPSAIPASEGLISVLPNQKNPL